MEVDQLLFARRSVRQFLEKPVKDEKLSRLLRAGTQAPSARNEQPWQFLVVRDTVQKQAIAAVQPHAQPASQAPVVLLLLVDLAKMEPGGTEYWPQDMAACAQNILLQAVVEGLGAVWLGIYPNADRIGALHRLLALPKGILPFCAIALGYPRQALPQPQCRFSAQLVHDEHYGNFWKNP